MIVFYYKQFSYSHNNEYIYQPKEQIEYIYRCIDN